MKIPQELVLVIFVGGIIVFFCLLFFQAERITAKTMITIKSLTVNDSLREGVKAWTGIQLFFTQCLVR